MKKLCLMVLVLIVFNSCTKNFEDINTNPNQITDKLLEQDFNLVGSPFSVMLYNLMGGQIEEDLCYDNWMGYMGTPTPFTSNVNNTTYYLQWNAYWDRVYSSVMSPSKQVIELAQQKNLPLFGDWAKFVRILAISKLTAIHGPVIFSNYGTGGLGTIKYDKESDLYTNIFTQLDQIETNFKANLTYTSFTKFDQSYKGSIPSWLKLINSIRLRLAMRIVKISPAVAKTQGEKALADPAGLITTNADNFMIALNGNVMPVSMISFDWQDTRMGGPIESFMVGLKDARISKYFAEVSDASLVTDHPTYKFKGIRNGGYVNAKDDRLSFSTVSADFKTVQKRRGFTASEISFLKAEAALRGWAGAGDAKTNYEDGVRLSFADWGASGVDAYLADATSKPISYIDPKDSKNNFTPLSTITVAWNAGDSNELKLEKIITQKYLATFTNTLEAWVDFRRTGYPKIPHVAKNDSGPTWGVIPADQWIKRLVFVNAERTGNAPAVAEAATFLTSGKDDIASRLWWDTSTVSNF
ncbi:SusD/RagB family nutrient-binding outer membrane lipoprotein [Pedobacter sp. BMA]|uniref:SusD/RagB family nutrient-binding outer membrane lipoprotein n=1 Tax=Pedobacter sp. BMA TaxID=1663685 RepID=UPI0006498B47|nr:SusD/RagB family nutrient-binding outer membrane lipoprotein [Pedobacter sp. BMA]KLT66657.1 hypothetical protein AB669_05660 [Pedobacter sp. BMA]